MLINQGKPIGTPPIAASSRPRERNLASSASVRSGPKIGRKSLTPSILRAKSPDLPARLSRHRRPATGGDGRHRLLGDGLVGRPILPAHHGDAGVLVIEGLDDLLDRMFGGGEQIEKTTLTSLPSEARGRMTGAARAVAARVKRRRLTARNTAISGKFGMGRSRCDPRRCLAPDERQISVWFPACVRRQASARVKTHKVVRRYLCFRPNSRRRRRRAVRQTLTQLGRSASV